eukprot:6175677-Pleurochrysis_carterae.AAC.5
MHVASGIGGRHYINVVRPAGRMNGHAPVLGRELCAGVGWFVSNGAEDNQPGRACERDVDYLAVEARRRDDVEMPTKTAFGL